MRLSSSVLVLSLLVSCGAAEPENCSVTENADGSATITCPDGSTATVTDGSDGSVDNDIAGQIELAVGHQAMLNHVFHSRDFDDSRTVRGSAGFR